jgi:hypothetical protein
MGLARVRYCIQIGILVIGVVKPESMIEGTKNKNAPKRPCCMVTAREDTISPIPTEDNRNNESPVYKVKIRPRSEILNQKTVNNSCFSKTNDKAGNSFAE